MNRPRSAASRSQLALVLCASWVLLGAASAPASPQDLTRRPNIVWILADDLGLGDVRACYAEGRIRTPHLDRLAREGLRFTDAHSPSAVCTPTRYGCLTGRYAWRTRLQSGVLMGYDPPLLAAERTTLPGLLAEKGYHTACIGKWHLGWSWPQADGTRVRGNEQRELLDWTRPIADGPTTRGFDDFFGIAASLDMPPYVFVEGALATEPGTATKKWIREGPAAPGFEAVDVLPQLLSRVESYLDARVEEPGRPFFLYLPLTAPHTPILPGPDFEGRSGLGAYGDFVQQVDAVVSGVREALFQRGLFDDTLFLFASDNGCSPAAGLAELRAQGHDPNAGRRGHKADLFEGGHRVPLIVRWPGTVEPLTVSEQTVCLTDVFATCAEIVGAKLPADAGEDSVSLLPVLEGRDRGPLREATVHHSINGSFAIRQGRWKLLLCADSGGWSPPKPGSPEAAELPSRQLYDLDADPAESRNLAVDHPEVVERLEALLQSYVDRGRSTPGPEVENDVEVRIAPPRERRK